MTNWAPSDGPLNQKAEHFLSISAPCLAFRAVDFQGLCCAA